MTYTLDKTKKAYTEHMTKQQAEKIFETGEEKFLKYLDITYKGEISKDYNSSIFWVRRKTDQLLNWLDDTEEVTNYYTAVINNLKSSDIDPELCAEAKGQLSKDEAAEAIEKNKTVSEVEEDRVSKPKIKSLYSKGLSIGEIVAETGADGKRVKEITK